MPEIFLYRLFLGEVDVKSVHKFSLLPACMNGTMFCLCVIKKKESSN